MSIMAEFGNFARFEENQRENIDFKSKTQLWLLSEVKIRKYTFDLIDLIFGKNCSFCFFEV